MDLLNVQRIEKASQFFLGYVECCQEDLGNFE